jgi:hypothetical protein
MDYTVTIHENQVQAVSPEGQSAQMPLGALLDALRPPVAETGPAPLPDGIRYVRSRGRVTVWVHETPPRVWNFKWIKANSPHDARETSYRDVAIALPYLVVVAAFQRGPGGQSTLCDCNECFFRTGPMRSIDKDELAIPALLNCSLFVPPEPRHNGRIATLEGRPVVWICTQYLDRAAYMAKPAESDDHRRALAFEELFRTLTCTGFNFSSEAHEYTSGFTESRRIDPRIGDVKAWERATDKDPDFVLGVPWVQTGYTVAAVIDRLFDRLHGGNPGATSVRDITRIVFNAQTPEVLPI